MGSSQGRTAGGWYKMEREGIEPRKQRRLREKRNRNKIGEEDTKRIITKQRTRGRKRVPRY